MTDRNTEIGRRFSNAAERYERNAPLQRLVVDELVHRIRDGVTEAPARILEIGCGTGLLTRRLRNLFPESLIIATDIAPAMLRACADSMAGDPRLLLLRMDGQAPSLAPGGFDLVCSSLTLQWFARPAESCRRLAQLVSPGGQFQVATLLDGSLARWDAAHRAELVQPRTPSMPLLDHLRSNTGLGWSEQAVAIPHADGLGFPRTLRAIGADLGRDDRRPLGAGTLRRVLRRFEADGAVADYRIGYGRWRRPVRRGVFVTGTDTGIGKTMVSACLVSAWGADYWKPMQTGLDEDPGDTATVQALSGCSPERLHRPALELRAPLSPEDAAEQEGICFDPGSLALPPGERFLVVEGAGGVLVPLDGRTLTTALIERLGLPVVLVARSTLGTINHTLLSIEALRARGIEIAGVVLNGPPSPGNRSAIERHGRVRVLVELPRVVDPGPADVARWAALFAPVSPGQ